MYKNTFIIGLIWMTLLSVFMVYMLKFYDDGSMLQMQYDTAVNSAINIDGYYIFPDGDRLVKINDTAYKMISDSITLLYSNNIIIQIAPDTIP